jgi:tetratricopeptide (TPR) repeat protein
MRSRLTLTAMVVGASLSHIHAQAPQPNLEAYAAAVRAYVSRGDLEGAVVPLQAFTSKHLDAAVARIIASSDPHLIEAASVFQLEVGIGAIVAFPTAASTHFRLGRILLDSLRPPQGERWGSLLLAFQTLRGTWFGVAASAFLSVNDVARARPWLSDALEMLPRSAPLRTLEGAAYDLEAAMANPDFYPDRKQKMRALLERRRRLALAVDAYREALRRDSEYLLAEIRLGRAQYLLEEYDASRVTLERAEPRAKTVQQRYLAALFLGAAYQVKGDLAAANNAYERALTAMPESQAAVVALSYLESITGRSGHARARVRAFAELAPDADRYWWAYTNGGIDETGLAWLRARVQR